MWVLGVAAASRNPFVLLLTPRLLLRLLMYSTSVCLHMCIGG